MRLNSWLRGRTAALRGARSLIYLYDMFRSLRAGRLASQTLGFGITPLRGISLRRNQPFTAGCPARSALQPHTSGRCSLHRRSTSRGFTLIELLAAISILAIVAVLSWRGLDTILRTRVALTTTLEQTRGLQLAFAQMQSDCENIVKSDDIGKRATLLAEPGRLTLVRTTYADDQPSRLQVVSYRLSNGMLSRRESEATRNLRVLDGLWSAASSDAELGTSVVLQSGVAAMNLRLWTNMAGWSAAGAPAPQPPGQTAAAAVPTGLEVTLQLGENQSGMVKVMLLGAI